MHLELYIAYFEQPQPGSSNNHKRHSSHVLFKNPTFSPLQILRRISRLFPTFVSHESCGGMSFQFQFRLFRSSVPIPLGGKDKYIGPLFEKLGNSGIVTRCSEIYLALIVFTVFSCKKKKSQ
ncbi:hypothetical protein CEXT_136001 [Caerostris extrusa]|uniref:Uncharacterized protein n=1 Tax=Caerostris extrusa TaxID=172846 RepID=A0AAV4XP01_CAEEX|nr:hypothetical protein CEXT_136001 [Caerostris extrusa]